MKKRYIENIIGEFCFGSHKMAFVSGPRQCGKTTFAKMLLKNRKSKAYFNWDNLNFRRLWTKDPSGIIPESTGQTPLVVLDEIHKDRRWKRNLKGVYDTLDFPCDILVTGSAKLNIYKKGKVVIACWADILIFDFTLSVLESCRILRRICLRTLFCNYSIGL